MSSDITGKAILNAIQLLGDPPQVSPQELVKRLVCEETVVQLLCRWGSLQTGAIVLDIGEDWGEKNFLGGGKVKRILKLATELIGPGQKNFVVRISEHLTCRVVSKQRPLGQLHQGLCDLSTVSMACICAVKNCGHKSARDKGKYRFFRFPAIVVNQGEEIRELSERRRMQWFANIYRKEFNDKKAEHSRLCSCHFISGK